MAASQTADLSAIRVDHTGALRAPKSLRDAFEDNRQGRMPKAAFERLREDTIADMIRRQQEIGLPFVTDGELRRRNFQDSFYGAVEGFDNVGDVHVGGQNLSTKPYTRTDPVGQWRWKVASRLRVVGNPVLDEFRASQAVATQPVKVTLLSVDRILDRFDYANSRGAYRDADDFLEDVVRIQRGIVQALVDAGCRYIQIDAPGYTSYVDDVCLREMRARGEDPEHNLARSIAAENAVIEGFDGVVFGLHICRGGARTLDPATGKVAPQWHREGHYDAIAERLFSELNHQRLLLEYDSDRAGGFEPLRFVGKDKVAVLGIVTTKSPDIESRDFLGRRIDEASRYLPLGQLALSPQCGFGGMRATAITEDVQWKKLEVIVDTARAVWG